MLEEELDDVPVLLGGGEAHARDRERAAPVRVHRVHVGACRMHEQSVEEAQ